MSLLALFRFFFALSGLDTGSPFAGVGASRELTLGILVEPMLILSLLVLALIAGSTHIEMIEQYAGNGLELAANHRTGVTGLWFCLLH
ncbi:NADH-quinone oxidoreductase subunit H [Escherichia coli]